MASTPTPIEAGVSATAASATAAAASSATTTATSSARICLNREEAGNHESSNPLQASFHRSEKVSSFIFSENLPERHPFDRSQPKEHAVQSAPFYWVAAPHRSLCR